MARIVPAWLLILLSAPALAAPVTPVARVGDAAPSGLPFSRFSDVAASGRGVVFLGSSTGIFRKTGAGIVRVAAAGDPLGAGQLAGVDAPALGTDGCVAFRGTLVGGGAVIVRGCGGTLQPLVAVGTAAPGGGTFTGFEPTVAIGTNGQLAFTGFLDDGRTGVFRAAGGPVEEVVRTETPAPAGGTFVGVHLLGIDGQGRVGFRGLVDDGPDGLFLWNGPGAPVAALAVSNSASPAGGQFTTVTNATVNAGGVWAFRAKIDGPNGRVNGVFRVDTSGLAPVFATVVLEGDPTPAGGTIRGLPTSLVPTINAGGAVAFRATLADADSSAGIFVGQPGGGLVQVALVGDTVGKSQLRRLRDPTIADDGSVLLGASLAEGANGFFVVRGTTVSALVALGDATDVGTGFRFSDPVARGTAEGAVFLGLQEAVYQSNGSGPLRQVAAIGGRAPLGGTYGAFDPPAGGAGRIVFGANVAGGQAGEGIVSAAGRRASATVRAGQRIAGGGKLVDLFPDTVDALARAAVAGGGIAFNATISHSKANAGVFAAAGGRLRAIARAGTPVGDGTMVAFGTPANAGHGQVAFVAEVRGGNSDSVLLVKGGGPARTLAAAGKVDETRLGSRFRALDPPVADGKQVLFHATLAEAGLEGLFLARGRQLAAIAGTGDDGPSGGRFGTFASPALAGDDVVFLATVGGGGVSARGLYRVNVPRGAALEDTPPVADAVVLVGDPSPLGGTFQDFGPPSGSPRGELAFVADLLGASAPGGVFYTRRLP